MKTENPFQNLRDAGHPLSRATAMSSLAQPGSKRKAEDPSGDEERQTARRKREASVLGTDAGFRALDPVLMARSISVPEPHQEPPLAGLEQDYEYEGYRQGDGKGAGVGTPKLVEPAYGEDALAIAKPAFGSPTLPPFMPPMERAQSLSIAKTPIPSGDTKAPPKVAFAPSAAGASSSLSPSRESSSEASSTPLATEAPPTAVAGRLRQILLGSGYLNPIAESLLVRVAGWVRAYVRRVRLRFEGLGKGRIWDGTKGYGGEIPLENRETQRNRLLSVLRRIAPQLGQYFQDLTDVQEKRRLPTAITSYQIKTRVGLVGPKVAYAPAHARRTQTLGKDELGRYIKARRMSFLEPSADKFKDWISGGKKLAMLPDLVKILGFLAREKIQAVVCVGLHLAGNGARHFDSANLEKAINIVDACKVWGDVDA